MLGKIPDPNLRAYVVWLPVLRSGGWESAARDQGERIPDPRARRYYDADTSVGKTYGPLLRLPRGLPAWDVYMVFGRDARWEAQPPAPAYWMHQLGLAAPSDLRLDGNRLAGVVKGLLNSPGSAGVSSALH
ncbi:MAG TPA: hypothetical protein VKM93_24180 [Terriglobia bacterium]|nr:hypothetical protein [Terriglobia bacterium]